ncbi:bifunctional BRCT domain superfamily/FCP1 homology domain/HAD superfamily/CTD phosphatase Fcp1/HAD-like superfamily/BRCT domain [Babesia duncani]|uniref:protein-serine/threonine phosphatase n=1 Tax=Babesia duncani TaxID=323732 RepID=A0AAD9PNL7_9APIC|nr:bifunctional BRCT domain superfamily/FCP1 homology domain/HAD superfamily/CTD phosphatase Fcp1/HAD-like superfamily/BRCT domain [Babesia duncani]
MESRTNKNNSRQSGKAWPRRSRHTSSAPYTDTAVPKVWPGMKAPAQMPKGIPPFGLMPKLPPMMAKMPPMMSMLSMMNPALYQQMLKEGGGNVEALEKKAQAVFAKMPPGPQVPLPLLKMMPMPMPGMFIPPPFLQIPKAAPPKSDATSSADSAPKRVPDGADRFETMSVISDEGGGNRSDSSDEASGSDSGSGGATGVSLVNTFVPIPPKRYGKNYTFHEVKMFSPLGLKAHAKAAGLSKESLQGFECAPVGDGKLVLLLDLDNTLLHAASQARLDMLDITPCHFMDEMQDPELYKFTLANFANMTYYMKLRPGIREFLQVLSLYYEMSIYTNATREYADVVISILDPDRSIFMDRIVARQSVGEREVLKTAARLYPNLNRRFIVCFDDRRDVWADIPHRQVVKAEHYDFFESHSLELTELYGPGSTDALDQNLPLDCDRHLHYMTQVFLELHQRFFKDPFNANVGDILQEMQSQVLKNVGVLLTGFRKAAKPQGGVLQADCEQHQRDLAQELGATLVGKLSDPRLTHVVAGKDNTDNVAKSGGVGFSHLQRVHTLWLYACRATWKNVSVEPFDLFDLCRAYNNEPPIQPCKDHWRLSRAHQDQSDGNGKPLRLKLPDPLPESELPTRVFMGTGPYSHGTQLLSPLERIVIKWDPAKTRLLQNMASDPVQAVSGAKPGMIHENAPYTNSLNPNLY